MENSIVILVRLFIFVPIFIIGGIVSFAIIVLAENNTPTQKIEAIAFFIAFLPTLIVAFLPTKILVKPPLLLKIYYFYIGLFITVGMFISMLKS
ncbi:MAG: hypothetical protein C0623_03565 [Desulfuromonas sp.]|nr:MAG: hypothetical protein C0623_03565 [Desulfuromonas sp.]